MEPSHNTASLTPVSKSQTNLSQLRRLYRLLVYKRLTIFIYGLSWLGPIIVALILAILAILFAPYVIFMLYENGKRGWLLAFAIVVGIPIGLLFLPTNVYMVRIILLYQPLLAFYFYCFVLRYSVADWISDATVEGETWVEAEDKANNPDEFSAKWASGRPEDP